MSASGSGRARVAVVSTYYHPVIGGAESAARRLAEYLARRGHPVFVLTRRTSPDDAELETVGGVRVRRRPPVGPRRALGKWMFLPVVFVDLLRMRAGFDVIVVVDQRGVGIAALAAARLLGCAVVFQPQTEGTLGRHHPLRTGLKGRLMSALTAPIRYLYGRADAIACITKSIAAEAREIGVPDSRLPYLPNPVDLARFAPGSVADRAAVRDAYDLGPSEIVFTFTGRLSREKGVRDLLLAWRHVARVGRTLLLIGPAMLGHPWDESRWVREFVEREGLTSTVRLVGPKPHHELAPILAAADVAVLPSHFEAHPLAAVEAMASGLPIIATRVGGVPDFVVPEVNGLLVPPHQPAALAAAMNRLADSPELRRSWSLAARRSVEPFSEDVVLERFAVMVESLSAGARISLQADPT